MLATEFLSYVQLRSILRVHILKNVNTGCNSDLDNKFRKIATGRRVVSVLCKLLFMASPDSLCHIKHQWEKDLGVAMTNSQ